MRRHLLILPLLSAAAGFFFASGDNLIEYRSHARKVNPATVEGMRQARQQMRIERRARGWSKPDSPGQYVRYHALVTTPDDATAPQYASNHRVTELERARQHRGILLKRETALPWIERGPGNVSGRTRAIVVDPDDPTHNTWIAAGVSGGVWKTTNAGQSWIESNTALTNLATTCLAMSASNHDVLYAGTGEGFFNTDAVRGNGIWRSTDRGSSWTQLSSTVTSDFWYVNRLIVNPQNVNIVLAATNTGIFRSVNGGASWTKTASPGSRVQQIIANPANFSTQFAAVNGAGVIRSYDGGLTWSYVYQPGAGRFEIAMASSDTSRLYASQDLGSVSALHISTDAGSTWSRITPVENVTVNWLGAQGWYDNTLVVHPFNSSIVFVGGIDVYRITVVPSSPSPFAMSAYVKLTNWYPDGVHAFVHADHHSLTVIPTGPSSFWLLNGNDGGVELSRDGGITWEKTLNGYNTTQFYGVDKMHGDDRYVGGMQDNGSWYCGSGPDRLSSWTELLGGDGFDVSWHYANANKILLSLYYNQLYRTPNQGASWESADRGLTDQGSGNAPFITAVAKSNIDPDLLFTIGRSGIWRSEDFGFSWTLVPLSSDVWGDGITGKAVISPRNTQMVWAGVRMASMAGRIHVSSDGGYSFRPTAVYPNVTLGRISGLAAHPLEDSTAFALFSFANRAKVLRTTDLGASWTDISGFGSGTSSINGFPDVAVYSLLVMPHKPQEIWVGTEIGLFISTDAGASWSYADNGLPPVAVWQMRIVDDEVVMATHGRGVWTVGVPELASYQPPVVPLAPRVLALGQAADGSLSIQVSLRSAYDSTVVLRNGTRSVILGATSAAVDTILSVAIVQRETVQVSVTAYRDGRTLLSGSRSLLVDPVAPAYYRYENNFDGPTADFVLSGFSQQTPSGFSNAAFHTPHPYANQSEYSFALRNPIIISSDDATIVYDEVAIVEPGETGAPFGSFDFYDYCVVEGTADGITWIPFEDGYDARRFTEWRNAWNINASGSSLLFRTHTINMRDRFEAGKRVFIRFRMFTDPGATGWGWVVDNVQVQANATDTVPPPPVPLSFEFSDPFPNPLSPFNPTTTFQFRIATDTRVRLRIYDMQGRLVTTLVDAVLPAQTHQVRWDAHAQASGIYFCRFEAGEMTKVRKIVLLR